MELSHTKAGATHDNVNARKIPKLKPSQISYWTQPATGGLNGPFQARLQARAVREVNPFDNGAAVAAANRLVRCRHNNLKKAVFVVLIIGLKPNNANLRGQLIPRCRRRQARHKPATFPYGNLESIHQNHILPPCHKQGECRTVDIFDTALIRGGGGHIYELLYPEPRQPPSTKNPPPGGRLLTLPARRDGRRRSFLSGIRVHDGPKSNISR